MNLETRIVAALSDELRRAPWRGTSNPLAGHCYVASEAAWHAMGGQASGWKPCTMRWEGSPHWFLRHQDGRVLDLTAGQFESTPDYSLGKGCGFLTRQPSKRAQVVLSRLRPFTAVDSRRRPCIL
jgi:hypothetical protein